MINEEKQNETEFSKLGIAISILGVLAKMDLKNPTPIQKKSIPVAINGQDLIGIAQTGTGKTFAFGIPMIQRLALYKGRGLILLPTRELALQVDENMRKLGGALGLRTASLIGGVPIGQQLMQLRRKPHILVATPGRLIDLLKRGAVKLDDIKILVLDEADLMFDMGFQPQIENILAQIPKVRQTMLFSATMPPAIVRLVSAHMSLPANIEVAPTGTTVEQVEQEMHIVKKEDKLAHLEKVLHQYAGSVLIFSRTKFGAKALVKAIQTMGHRAAEIHSNRTFAQRREALDGFKSKKYRILVATDIAARGIDVSGIELVLNYDLPESSEDYVHRIGRTGRAGQPGKAISFATPSQGKDIRNIENLIKKNLPLTKLAELDKQVSHARHFGYGRKSGFKKPGFSQPNNLNSYSRFKSPAGNQKKPFTKSPSSKPAGKPYKYVGSKSRHILYTDKQRFRASMQKAK